MIVLNPPTHNGTERPPYLKSLVISVQSASHPLKFPISLIDERSKLCAIGRCVYPLTCDGGMIDHAELNCDW